MYRVVSSWRQALHPLYFGPQARPLFGWLHLPEGTWSGTRVVVCPPLGYEGLFAHPTLRYLCLRLASECGAAVLRFDYDGTADSSGSDLDPDRVPSWLASVGCAIDCIRTLAPADGPVVLVGLRAGATLAANASAGRHDVDAVVLWAPVRGASFVREQRAFSKMAHATAAYRDGGVGDWGPDGFEANGYVYSTSTVAALRELDLRGCDGAMWRRVLVLKKDEKDDARDWALRLKQTSVEARVAPGYREMMEPPISMSQPTEAVDDICRFVSEMAVGRSVSPPGAVRSRTSAEVSTGISEEVTWYSESQPLFGIFTRPSTAPPVAGVILLNNAKGNRTGPHGMNASLARRLAEVGVATLRIDLADVGDSFLPPGRPEHHVYALDALADVEAAVDCLRKRGIERIAVGGLCSGAYLAWHAAAKLSGIDDIIMLNLQLFNWDEGRSLAVSPLQNQYESDYYTQAVRDPGKWLRLLRGQVNVVDVAQVMSARISRMLVSRAQQLIAAMGLARGSAIARELRSLKERGTRVRFIFSGHDPGLPALRAELGSQMHSLVREGKITVDVVDGPDHSFTPRWASERLIELFVDEMTTLATSRG